MRGYSGVIRIREGLVVIVDSSEDPSHSSEFYKINNFVGVIVTGELEKTKIFLDETFKDFKEIAGNFAAIITMTNEKIQAFAKAFPEIMTSLTFVGYSEDFEPFQFFSFATMGDGTINVNEFNINQDIAFSAAEQDICNYLAQKIYSKYMSIEEAKLMMTYITLQTHYVFRDISDFDIFTITKQKFAKVDKASQESMIKNSEKIDQKMKNELNDLFLELKS